MLRLLVHVVVLVVLASCGNSETAPSDSGLTSEVRPMTGGLDELRPGDQIVDVGEVGEIYTSMHGPARFGPGRGEMGRSIVVSLSIGIEGGDFDVSGIAATFEGDEGDAVPVEVAPCDTNALPSTIPDGGEETGCLSYYIPDGSGRLLLRGGGGFGYWIRVAA